MGWVTLLEDGYPHDGRRGETSPRPAGATVWASEAEALAHATEAACHAIEGIAPYTAGALPGQ